MRKTFRKTIGISIIVGCLFVANPSGVVFADDVVDSINEALEYYKEGEFNEAAESLDYASQLIRQQRGGQLESFLPDPLQGWTATEATSQTGAMMAAGMISAKREYQKGDRSVTIDITTEPPMLAGMMMMFSNPSIATAGGGKLKKVKRQKAVIKYDPSNQRGEITIVVAKRHLISIKGRQVAEQDLLDYASAIDYVKLKKF